MEKNMLSLTPAGRQIKLNQITQYPNWIIWAIKKFRYFLYGRHFTIVTDHKALQWLHTQKDTNKKLLRWSLELQDYDYTIKFRQGKHNGNADAVSRLSINTVHREDITRNADVLDYLRNNNLPENELSATQIKRKAEPYHMKDGKLYTRKTENFDERAVPSVDERPKIIEEAHHLSGHSHWKPTLELTKPNYYWPQMKDDIKKFILHCEECNLFNKKPTNSRRSMNYIHSEESKSISLAP